MPRDAEAMPAIVLYGLAGGKRCVVGDCSTVLGNRRQIASKTATEGNTK